MYFFRNYVLIPAIEEINICTDLVINYEEIKDGKKLVSIIFYIQSKLKFSKDYDNLRKDEIILKIQHKIHDRTGHIFQAKHMNNLHRKILLEFLTMFHEKIFDNTNIIYPENFFISVLNKIQNNYALELMKKKFKDY
jgi:plasmid replication initiation protein